MYHAIQLRQEGNVIGFFLFWRKPIEIRAFMQMQSGDAFQHHLRLSS
jgi:hypothetical protein